MQERVYDKGYPGGLHVIHGRVVDANGVNLDAPPGTPPLGDTGASALDREAAAAAEDERLAAWNAAALADVVATYRAEIDTALATTVADLDDYLATLTDPIAVAAIAAADTRVTAAAHYKARLTALGVSTDPANPVAVIPLPVSISDAEAEVLMGGPFGAPET